MSGIKVETQFKGKWHYEEYLLKNHRKEIYTYLLSTSYPKRLKKLIKQLYEWNVNKENIVKLYSHPPSVFIEHLCHGNLNQLTKYTPTRTIKQK